MRPSRNHVQSARGYIADLTEYLQGSCMFTANLFVQLLDREFLRLERPHDTGPDFIKTLVGVQYLQVTGTLARNFLPHLDDSLVEMRGLVMCVQRIDRGDNNGRLAPVNRFDEPDRVLEITYQVPVCIGHRRAFGRSVVMRTFEDEQRLPLISLAANQIRHVP